MSLATRISFALNLLLAGFVCWLASDGNRVTVSPVAPVASAHRVSRLKPAPASSPVAAVPTEVAAPDEPFHWSQIESTDYRIYVANLRAVGCPELTVRDIIIADVNELFRPRLKALVDEVSGQFWTLMLRHEDFEKVVDVKEKQLRALMEQRDAIFTDLFGDENPRRFGDHEQEIARQREQLESLVDFLPEAQRARFVAANENLENTWNEFVKKTPGLTDVQLAAKRKEFVAAHERALAEWLGPANFEELRLRQSAAAELRFQLPGMDLTEAEMRLAAKLKLDQNAAKVDKSDAQAPAPETAFQELLGPQRFAAYQRATDPRFGIIYGLAQRLELPDTAMTQAFDIRKQADDAVKKVQADKSYSAQERQATLEAIAAAARQSLAAALSQKGLAAYERLDGGWLHPEPPPPN